MEMRLVTVLVVLTVGLVCGEAHTPRRGGRKSPSDALTSPLHAQISPVDAPSPLDGQTTSDAHVVPDRNLRDLPCPNAADINPCVCTVVSDSEMNLDCSGVTSENQLAQIFSAYFPFKNFKFLNIRNNQYLKELREGDLGDATFKYIRIEGGVLETVQPGALSYNLPTAIGIGFTRNNISNFPYNEINLYDQIDWLDLGYNNIQYFPRLKSSTLTYISLDYNPMKELPLTAVQGLPNLEVCHLSGIGNTEILPGTFTGFPHLVEVYLEANYIQHIPAGVVHPGQHTSLSPYISFSDNNINSIEVDAIVGTRTGWLNIGYNSIEVMSEAVFRPLLDEGTRLWLSENPLDCGCSIAWLVTNHTYMSQLGLFARCHTGELLTELDPNMYDGMC